MKKIETMSQLRRQRRKLRDRRRALEQIITGDLDKIRYTLDPVLLARETLWSYLRSAGRRLLSK
ncbi:hypothetical protein ACQ86N_25630 [Puia sp. P3]|uniref:hypothetical protein n=1 Tax=Puia sp. P3 TaxID=3423952 RepID=UPI003D665804